MNQICTVCGSTWGQVVADATALGIHPGLLRSTYTCCQITEWALEQDVAWAEAAQEDLKVAEREETADELVPVCLRRPRATPLSNHEHRG